MRPCRSISQSENVATIIIWADCWRTAAKAIRWTTCTGDLLRSRITEVLRKLNYRQRTIIRLRYGLVGGRVHTLQEVGKMFGVSKERIRQLETAAMDKLKLPNLAEGWPASLKCRCRPRLGTERDARTPRYFFTAPVAP